MNDRLTCALAVTALANAITFRGPVDTVVQGRWVGSGWAARTTPRWESFFSLLRNGLNRRRWQSRDELRAAIVL